MSGERVSARGHRASALASMLLLVPSGLLVFGWLISRGFTTLTPHTDFRFHVAVARRMAAGGRLEVPHPLFHWLTAAVHAVLPGIGFGVAGLVVPLIAQVAVLIVVHLWLLRSLGRFGGAGTAASLGLTFALTLLAPLNQLTPAPREFYFGYVFPNTFHNPTNLVLRPLALGLFLVCLRLWTEPKRPRLLASAVLLTLASALAKPSHLICLLPAAALLVGFEAWRQEEARRALVAMGLAVLLPAAAVLAWQAWFTWNSGVMEPASMVIAPLAVVFELTRRDVPLLVSKVLLSMVFPLAVLLAYGRAALLDRSLRLAWLSFLFGLLYCYGLAETGSRFSNGNFLWSGQVTLFILFVASAEFAVRRSTENGAWAEARRWLPCAVALALHLASGIRYALGFVRTGAAY